MSSITEDQMWEAAKACGLLVATPGTQKWEVALFAHGRAVEKICALAAAGAV
jgi:hypothetical protein